MSSADSPVLADATTVGKAGSSLSLAPSHGDDAGTGDFPLTPIWDDLADRYADIAALPTTVLASADDAGGEDDA